MSVASHSIRLEQPTHAGLRSLRLAFAPGPTTALLAAFAADLLRAFQQHGHQVLDRISGNIDVLLTTARFGEPVSWRQAPLFSARRRFGLERAPGAVYTLIHATRRQFERVLASFQHALAQDPPSMDELDFPGLPSSAYRVFLEQGQRGGAILAMERLLQSQAKSIRIILVLGDETPEEVYHFDLVGAHPRSRADDPDALYSDIVLRVATTLSTDEVSQHRVVEQPIARATWQSLSTPPALRRAGAQLGQRAFFTEMVRISDLVQVPAVEDAIASQYSEGCFSTWEPALEALVATVTGSARPVDKRSLSDDDLAVIVGVRPDGKGALVRQVEGLHNDPPSSEAVEMFSIDRNLPQITWVDEAGHSLSVPVARSKLHGHRGVAAYDPHAVEYVPLDEPYYHYLVSCGTEAQARGIVAAFGRSQALRHPDDARQLVFTVLPGHGAFVLEKWLPGKAPLQAIWEALDAGLLVLDNQIPQGPMAYVPGSDGLMRLDTCEL